MVKRDLISALVLGLVGLLGVCFVGVFIVSGYTVKESDASTFLKADDFVMISKVTEPEYKDFVVYRADKQKHLGRVIAKGGDSVFFMDDIFYLNNQVEDDAYLTELKSAFHATNPDSLFTEDFTLTNLTQSDMSVIPDEYYLILNDNRQNTQDSREYGLISKTDIEGVVTFRVLPLSEFGFVSSE